MTQPPGRPGGPSFPPAPPGGGWLPPGPPVPAPRRPDPVWVATGLLAVVFAILLAVTVTLVVARGGTDGPAGATAPAPTGAREQPAGPQGAGPAPTGSATSDGSPGPTTSPATAATPGPQDLVLDASTGYSTFASPSGNIACALGAPEGEPFVRCEIGDVSWSVPRPADCDLDWGGGENGRGDVSVGGTGPASPVCAGDTVRDPEAAVLAYGSAIWLGEELVCRSAESGMRCENLRTGSGFAVSRSDLELF